MDERIAIWNILRSGKISAVTEEGDTLTVVVSIPDLRQRLKPLGDSFVLTLTGVRRAEWRGFGSSGPASAIHEGVQISGTGSRVMPIIIGITLGELTLDGIIWGQGARQDEITHDETMWGQIILDFQNIRFALDTGQASDYQTIERVYEEYWKEYWKNVTFRG